MVAAENPGVTANTAFTRDMVNVVVGIVWQTALTTTGIYLVLQDRYRLTWSVIAVAITSVWLKFNWYNKLEDYPSGYTPEDAAVETAQAFAIE